MGFFKKVKKVFFEEKTTEQKEKESSQAERAKVVLYPNKIICNGCGDPIEDEHGNPKKVYTIKYGNPPQRLTLDKKCWRKITKKGQIPPMLLK